MATADDIGLFVLPAELRLEIYQHLFDECLAVGHASEVAGLFLSCREVHRELEADFMTRARPLLEAKHNWLSTPYGNEALGMRVTPSLANTGKAELVIVLPKLPDVYSTFKSGLKHAGKALIPVYASTWSVLTLKLQPTAFKNAGHFLVARYQLRALFCGIKPSCSGSFQAFCEIGRLVVNCNNGHLPGIPMVTHQLSMAFGNIREYVNSVSPHRVAHQGWISKRNEGVDQGWQLALDFDHQGPVEGALWRLQASDHSVTVKRLTIVSHDEPSETVSDAEFRYINDMAGYASLTGNMESDSGSEGEDLDNTDGEDEAISDTDMQDEVDPVGEFEVSIEHESGDGEEMDEMKSDDYTEENESESDLST
jgi:hypothetical protein